MPEPALGVDQVGDKLALAYEVLDELALHCEALMHHLDRHLLGEPLRADLIGTEHRPHSPVGDLVHHLDVKMPLYFKQGCHKRNFKPPNHVSSTPNAKGQNIA